MIDSSLCILEGSRPSRVVTRLWQVGLLILAFTGTLAAQTTGKIAGFVRDADTGEPLIGANVIIDGTSLGAATDGSGEYFIINVSPGAYTLVFNMIGYQGLRVHDVRVSVNRTSYVEAELLSTVLEGQEVVVVRDRVAVKKDQTATIKNIDTEQLEMLPVENITAVVEMQAGVVQGHFRGGRDTEVSYLIDGLSVDESFDGRDAAVDLETESVQEVEVVTGTFNAEYGRAMGGVVNAVTKEGGAEYKASASVAFGNYYTGNDDVFIGLSPNEFDRNTDYKLQLSGPILSDWLTFFVNYRKQANKNHLNGIRRFVVDDFSMFQGAPPWISFASGDSAWVPMNRSYNTSVMAKLTNRLTDKIKISALYTLNQDEWHDYDHLFKYNPDGMPAAHRNTEMISVHLNHMITPAFFYEFKGARMINYNGYYVFEDPTDSNYVHDAYFQNVGSEFYTGGQSKTHSRRTMTDLNLKFDATLQAGKRHSFKAGGQYLKHNLDNRFSEIRNEFDGDEDEFEPEFDLERFKVIFPNYRPVALSDLTIYSDIYEVNPIEWAVYIQDKMEFNEMVINLGVRYDHFDPATVYPSDRRNPANQLNRPADQMSDYLPAPVIEQLSPRLGLSYQLGNKALLHFSYGHFFDMPPMWALYMNHSFQIAPSDYETITGNAKIHPEKTISYEVGLWQEVVDNLGIEVSLFYRDIYDLLSAKVISTYNQIEYGLMSNKDYGNTRGLEIKGEYTTSTLAAILNYTLQYTRGNADNPVFTFDRAGDSMDPVPKLIPMSWDQRHTLNLTLSYKTDNFMQTLTGYYNSGVPYTFVPVTESRLARVTLYPNNDKQPATYSFDLSGFYRLKVIGDIEVKLTWSVYNLLDRLNEEYVNNSTGRAYTAIVRDTQRENYRSNFSTLEEFIQNPSMYSAPRLIKIGLGVEF